MGKDGRAIAFDMRPGRRPSSTPWRAVVHRTAAFARPLWGALDEKCLVKGNISSSASASTTCRERDPTTSPKPTKEEGTAGSHPKKTPRVLFGKKRRSLRVVTSRIRKVAPQLSVRQKITFPAASIPWSGGGA